MTANLVGALVWVLVVTTQNVRFDMPAPQAHHDIGQAARGGSSIVLTQEMGLRRAGRFAPAGWGAAHFPGLRRGDCATYWNRAAWHRVAAYPVPLSHAPFRAGHRFALVTILRGHGLELATVCVHLITGSLSPARRPVFRRSIARLVVVLEHLRRRTPYVVVGGDWNRPYRARPHLPGFRTVEPRRATGHRGGRIDYTYWSRPHMWRRLVTVVGHTDSDHNGVRMRLGVR